MKPVYSIFFHNYYGEHARWMNLFSTSVSLPANLYYNAAESIYNSNTAAADFSSAGGGNNQLLTITARLSSNRGKDIGGKMLLLDSYQRLNNPSDYGLFLHDKKSLQKANNDTWAGNLLKIASPAFSGKAIKIFEQQPAVGIIGAAGNLADEHNHQTGQFGSTNGGLLKSLQQDFAVYPSTYHYITGTMFWFRMKPVIDFFNIYPPLSIRQVLEPGNVSDDQNGTYTHCWERLLCWIVTAQNFTIKMI